MRGRVNVLVGRAIGINRLYLRRWALGIGRWAFLSCHRHEFHSAFRAVAMMIRYDFRVHWAGVLLHAVFLPLALARRAGVGRAERRRVLVMGVLRDQCVS